MDGTAFDRPVETDPVCEVIVKSVAWRGGNHYLNVIEENPDAEPSPFIDNGENVGENTQNGKPKMRTDVSMSICMEIKH